MPAHYGARRAINLGAAPATNGVLTPPAGFKFALLNGRAVRLNGKLLIAKVA